MTKRTRARWFWVGGYYGWISIWIIRTIYQDIVGKEKVIEHINISWIDSKITLSIAIIAAIIFTYSTVRQFDQATKEDETK